MICIGQAVIARLETTNGESFPIERYEDYQQLGRFTLRDQVRHRHPSNHSLQNSHSRPFRDKPLPSERSPDLSLNKTKTPCHISYYLILETPTTRPSASVLYLYFSPSAILLNDIVGHGPRRQMENLVCYGVIFFFGAPTTDEWESSIVE